MNEVMMKGLQRYLYRLPEAAQAHYPQITSFMVQHFGCEPLYVDGSPAFMRGNMILRVGFFGDHANLFVRGSTLVSYFFDPTHLTPKGMVQWFYREPFPQETVIRWITAELDALPECTTS